MLYEWHDFIGKSVRASFQAAANALSFSGSLMNVFKHAASPPGYGELSAHFIKSASQLAELSQDQPDPGFGIWETRIGGKKYVVNEEVAADLPFGRLLHFKCETGGQPRNVPKILLVAPISGHKATILRDTVRELIPDADVYATDWKDAREVPKSKGDFTLETYMGYVQDFLHQIGPSTHMIGISQSTVPVLAVTSLMAARKDPCTPASMTLMCGPIDPRINETKISSLSRQHDIQWFRDHLIQTVPAGYPGRGRKVFPGYVQAMGLAVAAPQKKNDTPLFLVNKLFRGQGEKMDAHAPYYLDTIQQVFLEHRLPKGTMTWKNERVDPSKITNTGLLVIEGSADNITAVGQTRIAHEMCENIPARMKGYHLEPGAGHYDVFSGPHWSGGIYNKINTFIRNVAALQGIAYDPPQTVSGSNATENRYAQPGMAA